MRTMDSPITILLCALGGEGGGVLSEWLYDAAVAAGHSAQSTSIPGVAQRTGATTYYVEVFPLPDAALGGRRPLFSLSPVPGAIDLLVSSELLETVRQAGAGMASADRTTVVTSSARALTVAEKMQMGDGRVSDAALLAALQRHCRGADVLDMTALAREAGTAVSAVMLGAIAATGMLPLARPVFEDAIRRSGRGVEASLRGFASGFEAVRRSREARAALAATIAAAAPSVPSVPGEPRADPIDPALAQRFPAPVYDLLALGRARVAEYQDGAYADLYVERLDRVLQAERRADPLGRRGFEITREMVRWLALWMAFDDIVRVASLKLRASRAERVRREVAAREDEIVKVFDHFKPGVPELAALLPKALADRLQGWDARRRAGGREPWALPLKVATHTVGGALALRLLAALKGQRRRGSRFALEQSLIEQWLASVVEGTEADWALGHELAQCGRLIKGYGSTNERGKRNLLHIVEHLARRDGQAAAERADAVRSARLAALADDAGHSLDATLVRHGAPPRPVTEQPIRWHKRRPGTPAQGLSQRP